MQLKTVKSISNWVFQEVKVPLQLTRIPTQMQSSVVYSESDYLLSKWVSMVRSTYQVMMLFEQVDCTVVHEKGAANVYSTVFFVVNSS